MSLAGCVAKNQEEKQLLSLLSKELPQAAAGKWDK
jgi:hypothetical protein